MFSVSQQQLQASKKMAQHVTKFFRINYATGCHPILWPQTRTMREDVEPNNDFVFIHLCLAPRPASSSASMAVRLLTILSFFPITRNKGVLGDCFTNNLNWTIQVLSYTLQIFISYSNR
jgi:hypothetical protein